MKIEEIDHTVTDFVIVTIMLILSKDLMRVIRAIVSQILA